ncbi:hypothetical protein ACFFJ7_15760 [Pseudochelatococcus lubricantis]|uniref:hypothetical protein n=1 Tax=Pseudochelatococcus lubricantis TaxID=1538102 RepID=UPI0035EAADC6
MSDRRYRRIVIHLRGGAFHTEAVRLAGDLARLMGIDLLGRFVRDENVARLAGLPAVREFRLPEREWHTIEDASATMELAAAASRRLFAQVAGACSARYLFETAPALNGMPEAEDIVVVPPRGAGEPAPTRTEAEPKGAAGMLFVPYRIARRQGPVIAFTAGSDEPALATAAAIAASAGERLLHLRLPETPGIPAAPGPGFPTPRLVVFGRMPADTDLPAAMLRRGIPVLILREDRPAEPAEPPRRPENHG